MALLESETFHFSQTRQGGFAVAPVQDQVPLAPRTGVDGIAPVDRYRMGHPWKTLRWQGEMDGCCRLVVISDAILPPPQIRKFFRKR